MDVNLRKTATDTAYVVVGVGVLGFQQAQVKRRDAVAKVSAHRAGTPRARSTAGTDSIKARSNDCAASLGDLGATVGTGTVGSLGSTVSRHGQLDRRQHHRRRRQPGEGRRRRGPHAPTPAVWVEPVVGDLRVRVEPVVEQLRTISLPGTVAAIPDQVAKTIEVGKARVQGRPATPRPRPPERRA